ncbi:MAG TPA: malto-oligosyltrehalose synthase [Bryobacteraceae bacterium]|nr:malto-oligosyltrehalose synthase [Bryobacteraceae bacterium]
MTRIPIATYRLQLHAGFGFDAAAEIAQYLHQLGISHVYSSPYLQAAPGSQHGYDVVDHHKVNDELGGAEAHERFSQSLHACNLGQVLDIVPNHMAISVRRNRYWWDVLENGPSSRYSIYFDIDWNSHEEKLRNKLLVPILGDHYGRAVERGEIQLLRRGADFFFRYFDHELPASPRSLVPILAVAATETGSDYLDFLSDSLERLPGPTLTDRASVAERHRNKRVVMDLLDRLFKDTPFIADAVDQEIAKRNRSPDCLDELLELQNYRLSSWQAAKQDLGYRRFFDVNSLVGLRVEDPQVFADTHVLVFRWLREGVLDGIRVDHPDGLLDPRQYFERLRAEAPDVWILAEKILESGENLPPEWPIDGTTGYDYLNQAGALFVDSANEEEFNRLYTALTGDSTDYAAICREKKHLVLRELLGSDVNRLTALLANIFENHREQRDFTRIDAARAIRELVACFSVYRSYVVPERGEITQEDKHYIDEAVAAAKNNRPEIDPDLFDFIGSVLLLRVRGELESEFVLRFQQFTGPAMAKGVEDTVFYCYNRLIALNEVGGDPSRFGISPEEFHESRRQVSETHPRAMLASSTHDTKRSEDVRCRLALLSEIPQEWEQAFTRWSAANAKYKSCDCFDSNTEYFLYQTMLGAWPIEPDRLLLYMGKATREAKRKTSWLTPNEPFENATRGFIESIYHDDAFLDDFENFVQFLIEPGRVNSLSLTLLKLTSPGIPDFYQGTEIWDLSLVDPDNRRPVDYEVRRRLLAELPHLDVKQVMSRMDEGLPKMWTIFHTLRARRAQEECFGDSGVYTPLYATGPKAGHAVAYRRGENALVVLPRLVLTLNGHWSGTKLQLPAGQWKNELTGLHFSGGDLEMSDLFAAFPVALLIKQ